MDQQQFLINTTAADAVPVQQYVGSMVVAIDGQTLPRFVGIKGQPATFRVECSLPITDSFAVPLAGLFGAAGKTFMFEFVNGVAEREIVFDVSGEWVVTEEQINAHLPVDQHFQFAGLNISIGE